MSHANEIERLRGEVRKWRRRAGIWQRECEIARAAAAPSSVREGGGRPDPNGWHDAGIHAFRAWERFSEARSPVEQARALAEMNNAMWDLVTWLPGWNSDTSELETPDVAA